MKIIARAADDSDFRDKLAADPKGTLEEELGTALPDDVKILVLEDTANQVYLVLPAAGSKELSSSELASVAGGAGLVDMFEAQQAANAAQLSQRWAGHDEHQLTTKRTAANDRGDLWRADPSRSP